MPNYVKHTVVIIGEQSDIELVVKSITNAEHGGGIDFNKVIPMPVELQGTRSPVKIISEKEYKKQEELKAKNSALGISKTDMFNDDGITEAVQKDLIKRFGADNWYDWSCKHWGTKWNACDSEPPTMGERNGMTTATFNFETAWSCAYNVLEEISKNFPNVTIETMFADEDWGSNCGTFELRNGEVIDECIPDSGSEEAKMIATEMWGKWDDEEEDEDE
jgi:hypothetical protein